MGWPPHRGPPSGPVKASYVPIMASLVVVRPPMCAVPLVVPLVVVPLVLRSHNGFPGGRPSPPVRAVPLVVPLVVVPIMASLVVPPVVLLVVPSWSPGWSSHCSPPGPPHSWSPY